MLPPSHALIAQKTDARIVTCDGTIIEKGGIAESATVPCSGEPYTAIRKTTRVERLGNGTAISHESTSKQARDFDGRIYQESQIECCLSSKGKQLPLTTSYWVIDYEKRTNITWSSNGKEAIVFYWPDPGHMEGTSPHGTDVQFQVESLGTKTINGLEAKGTRMTYTAEDGQPRTVTSERWYSVEFKTLVFSIEDDPRMGISTTEMTDFQRGAPAPALFKIPAGYSVRDVDMSQKN